MKIEVFEIIEAQRERESHFSGEKNVRKNKEKCIYKWHNPSVRIKDSTDGITLIALVITIIVLLILARNKYFDVKWR